MINFTEEDNTILSIDNRLTFPWENEKRRFPEKKIIDNFLSFEESKFILDTLSDDNFPWYCNQDGVSGKKDDNPMDFYFIHAFYDEFRPISGRLDLINPIFKKLNVKAPVRIKANLYPHTQEVRRHGFHSDQDYDLNACLYYVNTNNGVTTFEDGTVVESVFNRAVFFNSFEPHCSSSTSDTKFRITINFNYF